MQKSKGFTLIELVVVIILLGILASTALPKLINLRSDAKAGNLQAIKGSMESALQLVYSRAVIKGESVDTNNQLRAWLNIDSTDKNSRQNHIFILLIIMN